MKSSKTTRFRLLQLWGLCLLILVGNHAFAQTKVNGKVNIERIATPPVGATITIKNTRVFIVVDETERFTGPDQYYAGQVKMKLLLVKTTSSSGKSGRNQVPTKC